MAQRGPSGDAAVHDRFGLPPARGRVIASATEHASAAAGAGEVLGHGRTRRGARDRATASAQEHASGARPGDACFATIAITSSPGTTSPHLVQTGSDSPESPA